MKICRKNSNFWAIGVSAVLAILIVFILSRLFAVIMISPDDIGFQNILSGSMTGTPDGHTHFLQYPLSALLAFLYRIFSRVSWYKLFLVCALVLSFFLIFARVCRVAAGRKILYLATTVLLVFLLFSGDVIHLEWTVISGVMGATAIFRFVTIPEKVRPWERALEYAACILLLVLCFCLRNTVAYMFIPLAGLCWLYKVLKILQKTEPEKRKKAITPLVVFLAVCIGVVGAGMVIHRIAYGSEGWKAYQDYTKDRSALFDYYGYPDYMTYEQEYQAAGISYEAYIIMREDYNFIIPCDNFKDMDLEAIADLAKQIHTKDVVEKLKATYYTMKEIFVGEEYALLNVIIVVLITCNFCMYKEKKVIDVLFIAATVVWALAFAFYLAYDGRLPERVVRCIDYGLIMVLFGNCMVQWLNHPHREKTDVPITQKIVSIMLAVIMLGFVFVKFINLRGTNANKENLAIAHSEIQQYCANNPENMYLRDFWSFSQRGELFLKTVECSNYVNAGGWIYHSPVYDELLEKWDCEDVFQAIEENDNLYYLVNENRYNYVNSRLNAFFAGVAEEKGLHVTMKLVDSFETVHEKVLVLKFSGASVNK